MSTHDAFNSRFHLMSLVVGCLLAFVPAHAQVAMPRPGAPIRSAQNPNHAPREVPCWQQAGISKATMSQRRSIEQNTHAQVEAVCADPSLSTPQKREKIKEIRQQAKQQVEEIITPEQQQELKACNASRAAAHPPQQGPHPGPAPGPCANLGSANPAPPPAGETQEPQQQ